MNRFIYIGKLFLSFTLEAWGAVYNIDGIKTSDGGQLGFYSSIVSEAEPLRKTSVRSSPDRNHYTLIMTAIKVLIITLPVNKKGKNNMSGKPNDGIYWQQKSFNSY